MSRALGHGRTQCLEVDEARHHYPTVCVACSGHLDKEGPERTASAHDLIDLDLPASGRCGLEVIQRNHLDHPRQCACGHWTCADPATGGDEVGGV